MEYHSSPPSSSDGGSTLAERRLLEVDKRLKMSIEELQRHYARQGGGGGGNIHGAADRPICDHGDESCVAHALGNLCQSFFLSYGVRVGIGILLRAFKLARRRSYSSILDLKVMYAFVMRPEALPKAYQDFIQKTGPVSEPVYKAVRDTCRGSSVDVVSLYAYLANIKGPSPLKFTEDPSIIPCSLIHPYSDSCVAHNAAAASSTFRKTFPLYFSLTFVPFVVLRLQKFLKSPFQTSWLAVFGAVRSTTFLSAFVALFQAVICLHRKVAIRDHKLVYWISGAIAGLAVLLEKKGRRSELALYVLPRAGDSLWYIMVNRHLLPDVKNAEVALFCLCMGGIMYFLEHEPDTMAPLLRGLIRRFLASRISNPSPPFNRNASYPYLQNISVIDNSKLRENEENRATSLAKYNLESIPGL